MNKTIAKFSDKLQRNLKDAEKRLEALTAKTQEKAEQADTFVRAHVAELDERALKAKASLEAARVDMMEWAKETKESLLDWKANRDAKHVNTHADRAERYADAALVVALAGVDEAEKAMLHASLARAAADASATAKAA
jgi:hypothetical protein